jgi:geranylgeranyl diphosphate synthase, type I
MTITMTPSLQRTRDAVLPALRSAVQLMDSTSAAMASYHFGWTDIDGRPREAAGGKALRPTLALLSARAAGASPDVGVAGAVAVELVHNFSLIHDDVMDRDEQRHHRPTVWCVWGVPSAILTGDAMLVAAHQVLLDSASPYATDALRLLLDATRELIGGQAADLDFESRHHVSLADCQRMTAGKTGALLSASAAIGAVLAGAPASTTNALARYGDHLGAAFQLVDDLLGIWGDPAVTGKPVLSDLRSRKKSLPVTYALSRGTATSEELARRLRRTGRSSDAELARTADLVESAGGRTWAAAEAERQAQLAQAAIRAIEMDAVTRTELREVADFVVARRH